MPVVFPNPYFSTYSCMAVSLIVPPCEAPA